MGHLTPFLQEQFERHCPSGWTCRHEVELLSSPLSRRLGYQPRADVLLERQDGSRRLWIEFEVSRADPVANHVKFATSHLFQPQPSQDSFVATVSAHVTRGRRNLAGHTVLLMRHLGMNAFQTVLLPQLSGEQIKNLNHTRKEELSGHSLAVEREIERALAVSETVGRAQGHRIHYAGDWMDVWANVQRWNDELRDEYQRELWGRRTIKYFVFDPVTRRFAPSKFCAFLRVPECGRHPNPHGRRGMKVLREVLFSPGNIAEKEKCYDRLEPLRKLDINPVFQSERAWEAEGIHWGSVIKSEVDGRFKFFYSTAYPLSLEPGTVLIDNSELGSQQHVCCYAESDDGVHWRRPPLNRMLQETFPNNNIIWHWPGYFNDSLSVIEDTLDSDPRRRYKMLIYHHDSEDPDLCGGFPFVSPDGLEWTRTSTVLPTQDAECLWQDRSTGRYYAFLKDRVGSNRSRMLCTSDDFSEWSEPQWIITPDHGDHPGTNFYNQTAFTMAGRALGFLNVYDVTTQTSWVELVESGDTLNWRRMPSRSPLLQPSGPGSLDGGGVYLGLNEPILVGDEYWYYYYASPRRHSESDVSTTQKPTLCVAAFTRNRLVGQQTEGEGSFATLPFRCPGGRLRLNFASTEPVSVALKRAGYGGEYQGFTREECEPISGDLQDGEIRWTSGKTPADLEGRFVRIKVYGKNAVVYSAAFVA